MNQNTKIALNLHNLFDQLTKYTYPFEEFLDKIPSNGIYLKFEKGEKFQGLNRIVRIGTHTGENQLHSRLSQHFETENQRRSIFRQNIGRCFLNRDNNPYLKNWDLPITSKVDKEKNLKYLDLDFEKGIEKEISNYIQSNFSFCVFKVDNKIDRLYWESKIIATLAQSAIIPSTNWLGNYSPKSKIKEYGLWQVQGINKPKLTRDEFEKLEKIISEN
jgi:hypothetical protein